MKEVTKASVRSRFPAVYPQLRRLAQRFMEGERVDHTLEATAVVHEAFVRLLELELPLRNRAHLFAMASRLMRRVLVDYAKGHRSRKRGGSLRKVPLSPDDGASGHLDPNLGPNLADLVDLDRALDDLEGVDPRKVRVLELRFFAGMTLFEIAAALEISKATVERDLDMAKAWLHDTLGRPGSGRPSTDRTS